MLDYTKLGDRAKVAKDNLGKDNEPLDLGEYKCILRKGEFAPSRAGNPMFTLHMRIKDPAASERMQGETLRIRFVITANTPHQLDQFLAILNDWGCDLKGKNKVTRDEDWEDLFIDLIAARPKAVVEVVKDEKNDKYYNFFWKEVIRCLNLDDIDGLEVEVDSEDEDDEPEPKPKPKPKKKKPAAPKKPTPPPAPEADDDDDDDDW